MKQGDTAYSSITKHGRPIDYEYDSNRAQPLLNATHYFSLGQPLPKVTRTGMQWFICLHWGYIKTLRENGFYNNKRMCECSRKDYGDSYDMHDCTHYDDYGDWGFGSIDYPWESVNESIPIVYYDVGAPVISKRKHYHRNFTRDTVSYAEPPGAWGRYYGPACTRYASHHLVIEIWHNIIYDNFCQKRARYMRYLQSNDYGQAVDVKIDVDVTQSPSCHVKIIPKPVDESILHEPVSNTLIARRSPNPYHIIINRYKYCIANDCWHDQQKLVDDLQRIVKKIDTNYHIMSMWEKSQSLYGWQPNSNRQQVTKQMLKNYIANNQRKSLFHQMLHSLYRVILYFELKKLYPRLKKVDSKHQTLVPYIILEGTGVDYRDTFEELYFIAYEKRYPKNTSNSYCSPYTNNFRDEFWKEVRPQFIPFQAYNYNILSMALTRKGILDDTMPDTDWFPMQRDAGIDFLKQYVMQSSVYNITPDIDMHPLIIRVWGSIDNYIDYVKHCIFEYAAKWYQFFHHPNNNKYILSDSTKTKKETISALYNLLILKMSGKVCSDAFPNIATFPV